MEVFVAFIFMMLIFLIIGGISYVVNKTEEQKIEKQVETETEEDRRTLCEIYVRIGRSLQVSFDKYVVFYSTKLSNGDFILERLCQKGFIECLSKEKIIRDKNWVYLYTRPATYRLTNKSLVTIQLAPSNYFPPKKQELDIEKLSSEELMKLALDKYGKERRTMVNQIKNLETKLSTVQSDVDWQETRLTLLSIRYYIDHYCR